MQKIITILNDTIVTLMLGCIQIYRWTLSPFIGGFCRFKPTCSRYTQEAILLHGPWVGGWMGVKRICNCRPGGGFGFDPVPRHVMKRGQKGPDAPPPTDTPNKSVS